MASTYSTNLAIELIGTGDQAGTWGNTTNTNLGTLIEQAISGYVTQAVSTGTDTTITIPNGATGVARNMYIELTGTGGAATNLIVPANKKLYFIFNNTSSGQVTVKVSGQTGVSVPNKAKMVLVSNGTDIVDATNYMANISAASANITTLTGTTLTYSSGTITNLASTSLTLSNNPTFSGGTANGVLFLNGSKVATSGSALVFDGTNLGLGVTPSAWRTSEYKAVQVGIGASFYGRVTAGDEDKAGFSANAFFDQTDNRWEYIATDSASRYDQLSGGHFWFTAPSGTAGNAISFTQAMTLNASENLLVGTTTDKGYRVLVSGADADDDPVLGSATGAFHVSNSDVTYGMDFGVSSDGKGWIQQQSNTGVATAYDLSLQPVGGNLGIGTSSPDNKLEVTVGDNAGINIEQSGAVQTGFLNFRDSDGALAGRISYDHSNNAMRLTTNETEKVRITSAGDVGIGTSSPAYKLNVTNSANDNTTIGVTNSTSGTSALARFLAVSNAGNGFFGMTSPGYTDISSAADALVINASSASGGIVLAQDGVGQAWLNTSGNLGLGVTPSAWSVGKAIEVGAVGNSIWGNGAANIRVLSNAYYDGAFKYATSAAASQYTQDGGTHAWSVAASGTAGNAITFTQAMTLDASGNLTLAKNKLFGISTSDGSDDGYLALCGAGADGSARGGHIYLSGNERSGATGTVVVAAGNVAGGIIEFRTGADAERARITSGGTLLVGKTADSDTGTGVRLLADGLVQATREADPLSVNRINSDGTVVSIRQDGVEEGTISVSGNTVSYNAFAGSHWSQLQDGSKPDILRGTVMESINELCVWPGEQNERLPKAKISDTAGSKKVYGVFMAWDNDWTTTNDMYVTAVGAFICRVNASVTVEEGDLLESNGDGTARVQADDIIRSSTIGKVTSTVKTHQYDDGSYCVPTVLYCG